MTSAFAPITALLASVAILLAGNGLQGTLLPVRAQIEQFGTPAIGALGSSYYIGFALGCLLGAHLLRRAGHIRVFTAMASIASAAALAHAMILSPVAWWFLRGTTGFCFAVLYMVIESWLNERSTSETRGVVLSVYLIINLTVITLGQLMVVLYDPAGFASFALASILVSLAAVPVAMTAAAAPGPVETVHVRIFRLYTLSPVGFVACVVVGLTNGSFWSLGPVFAQQVGLDLTGVAVFMSITVIAGAIGQWPLGRLSDRTDRRNVIILTCLGAAFAAALLSFSLGRWELGYYVGTVLYGLFSFPIYAIAVAHTNDFVSKDEFVEAASGLLLLFGAGAALGPILAALGMDAFGPVGLYMFTAVVHAFMVGFALWRRHVRAIPPAEERTGFLEALEAAATVSPTFELEALHEAQARETERPAPAHDRAQD